MLFFFLKNWLNPWILSDNIMFKIIITESVLTGIKAQEESKPVQSRSRLYKLLQQQEPQIINDTDTALLKESPEKVLNNPAALYILDITPQEAISIQRSFGVMCLSGDDPDITPLIDINDVHISNEREKLGRGWDSVLDSVEKLPSNAILINDRYLFASKNANIGDGFANVYDILKEVMPGRFDGGDYHVTIVFDNENKDQDYTFNEISLKLNKLKLQLGKDYPIMMEVLGTTHNCSVYNKLHNRLIISNYFFVEAAHKLAAFNKDIGTTRQTLLPMTLFTESSINGTTTPPFKVIDQTMNDIRDFSKSLSTLSDHSVYAYAVNGKRMERCIAIRNRLLK